MAADQPPATDAAAVNKTGSAPEHGADIVKRIRRIEIEPGMDDDEVVQQDIERKGIQKIPVDAGDVAGTVGLKAFQRVLSTVGFPQAQVEMIITGLQEHLLMVAANSADRQAAPTEFEDKIQHPLAVRSQVDQVSQKVDAVVGDGTE